MTVSGEKLATKVRYAMQQRRKAVETTEAGGLYRPDDGAVFDVDNEVIDLTGRRRKQAGAPTPSKKSTKDAEIGEPDSGQTLDLEQVERVLPAVDRKAPKRNLRERKLGQPETGGLLRRFRRY